MIWRMGKGQMRLLIISPAQVMIDPGSAALWHWKGTGTDFFILSSQQAPNQDDAFFFFFWANAIVRFLVRAFMLDCKYFREETVTSFPPDLPQTHTHIWTSPLSCITLIGAQGMQALPDTTLPSLCLCLSMSKSLFSLSHLLLSLSDRGLTASFI